MEPILTQEHTVHVSLCDHTARLSRGALFSLFMDIATEHAEALGIGLGMLRQRDLFWMTVRTRIRIRRRPAMLETVRLTTWPETPGRLRCNRDYVLSAGDEILAEGKTEWAIVDTATGRPHAPADVYPPELREAVTPRPVWDGPFARISEDFSGAEILGDYTVRSTDVDLGGHMNNAAYPRMIFGFFSAARMEELDWTDMEICYRAPCYEGERLKLLLREGEDGLDIGVFRPDGRTAALSRLR